MLNRWVQGRVNGSVIELKHRLKVTIASSYHQGMNTIYVHTVFVSAVEFIVNSNVKAFITNKYKDFEEFT